MNTTVQIVDENEVKVEFSGDILVCRPQLEKFKQELEELIDDYAL